MIDHILGYLAGEIHLLPSLFAAANTLFLGVILFFAAKLVYQQFGLEFLCLDGIYKPFEAEFYKTFAFYCLWALAQQVVLTFTLSLTGLSDFLAYAFCVGIFSCIFHFPNERLIIATALFGLIVYPFYVFTATLSVVHVALLHAFAGTSFKLLGWDMRVWRFK